MHVLFPEIKPNREWQLPVSDGHVLYVEESGSPNGLPVVVVHGGPGAGCDPMHRRFFDPEKYRIILFDQRGAGRSRPHASVENNTTQHLIADMEAIREHLDIDKWVLFGGSWGSTLSLLYAETHPERTHGLILRGIFLARPEELDWYHGHGTPAIFPDYFEEFIKVLPEEERKDPITAYRKRLFGDDELARMAAAKGWSIWEARTSTLNPNPSLVDHCSDPHTALAMARIECHYFDNDCFLKPNQILQQAQRLEGIPGIIVHGRYDMVCPLENAWLLTKLWPEAELAIIRDAGHAASEPGITDALIRASRDMHQLLSRDYSGNSV